MNFVDPQLSPLLERVSKLPGMPDIPVAEARERIINAAKARGDGPSIHTVDDIKFNGPHGDIPVRMYRPENAQGCAIWFHGGGWTLGSVDTYDATARQLALDANIAVFSVDYRLSPEYPFPAPLDDCWAAFEAIAKSGASFGVDTSRLIVGGESAGGNLAAVVSLMARDSAIKSLRLQVLIHPAVDARGGYASLQEFSEGYLMSPGEVEWSLRNYGLGKTVDANDWRLSPILGRLEGVAPALVITAECDPVRDEGETYARLLKKSGVDTALIRYAGMVHTFYGMGRSVSTARLAQLQVAAAIQRALKDCERHDGT